MAREKGADEIFCRSCGEPIKAQAEICPHCGVRNQGADRVSVSNTNNQQSRANTSDLSMDMGTSETIHTGLIALQWGLGILLLLAGIGSLTSGGSVVGWIISFIQGLLFLAIGALLIPPIREKISIEYPMSTFGKVRSVNQEFLQNPNEVCDACYDGIERGVSRTYKEQFVLFGAPLFTSGRGENNYCRSCANGEPKVNVEKATES